MLTERGREVGARVSGDTTTFRVWAPRTRSVTVVTEGNGATRRFEMAQEEEGYFVAAAPVPAGTLYRYQLDNDGMFPDPASRYQPQGPHGPSAVIDPADFAWTDATWSGPAMDDMVVYELHIGTFTAEGTWRAAMGRLPDLVALGITVIEVMPIADFPGRFGWGYDGVSFFAPSRLYGTPDDARAFVNRAHELGLSVVLDVVYNHAGPDGCWLGSYASDYFSSQTNDWGRAFNFAGPDAGPVRAFFEQNARYWIEEFHFDGLRLDATQNLIDSSLSHIIQTVADAARRAAPTRRIWIVAENEPQDSRLVRPVDEGGFGIDALWNDDFHHSARVAATGMREAYYSDYVGRAGEFVTAATRGFLYQGQWYGWQNRRRGTSTAGLVPRTFVAFLENHDQVANSRDGARLHTLTPPALWRTLTAVLLLGPWVPMLFHGQENNSRSPFLYFADHAGDLAASVMAGRKEFLRQFPSIRAALLNGAVLDAPHDDSTFARSHVEVGATTQNHREALALHTSLLSLRRGDPFVRHAGVLGVDAAVLGPDAWVMRYRTPPGVSGARLLVVNLGPRLDLKVVTEPLLAAPGDQPWRVIWHSEACDVGGSGAQELAFLEAWHIPEASAWLLES